MGSKNFLNKQVSIIHYAFIYTFLLCKGFSSISIFKYRDWHHRVSYYTAITPEGNKVFIKTSGSYRAAKREFIALSLLNDKQRKKLFPSVMGYVNLFITSFVMIEFIQGDLLSNHPVSKERLREFCHEVNESLIDKQVIHRDIRPQNIIITEQGEPLLIDFGWAIIEGNGFSDAKRIKSMKALGLEYRAAESYWNDSVSLMKVYSNLYNEELTLSRSPDYLYEK